MIYKTFDEAIIEAVWRKGKAVSLLGNLTRKDICGATIKRSEYGNRNSEYGWEIDHIDPNGSDNLINLQPLQWKNNVEKSDKHSRNYCVVTS